MYEYTRVYRVPVLCVLKVAKNNCTRISYINPNEHGKQNKYNNNN